MPSPTIITWPDKRLQQPSISANGMTLSNLEELYREMCHAMYFYDGIGLAAVQIGHPIRMIIIDGNLTGLTVKPRHRKMWRPAKEPLALIEPFLSVQAGGTSTADEHCLSFPGSKASVTRPAFIKAVAANLDGEEFDIEAYDLAARCILHELDHLEGVTLANYVSAYARERMARQAKKLLADPRSVSAPSRAG